MTDQTRVLAVDLGATSIRVASVDLSSSRPEVEVVHRWQHSPQTDSDGSLRWDWPRIVEEVEEGLAKGMASGPVASIGVDGWGVDYGLIDRDGELVGLPYSYRDRRTDGWRATAEAIGPDYLYAVTGVQLMGINTIFQLATHDRAELDAAARVLLLPDLLIRQLGGSEATERSNASTTGLMDARTGEWAHKLIDNLGLDASLFTDVASAGTLAGAWRGVPLHLVGSHDTASAFLGMPGGSVPGTVFVSTGTWVLVGVERPAVDTSPARGRQTSPTRRVPSAGSDFSRMSSGSGSSINAARVGAIRLSSSCSTKQPRSRTLCPHSTPATCDSSRRPTWSRRSRAAADLTADASRSVIVRTVLESIVEGIATVVDTLSGLTGKAMSQLAIVGGGARVQLLQDLLAARTGLPVIKGSPEATALGNAVAQGIALGRFDDLTGARNWLDTAR